VRRMRREMSFMNDVMRWWACICVVFRYFQSKCNRRDQRQHCLAVHPISCPGYHHAPSVYLPRHRWLVIPLVSRGVRTLSRRSQSLVSRVKMTVASLLGESLIL
jgi:hypothetical protein